MPRAAVTATAPRFVSLANVMPHKRHWRVSAMAYVYRLHTLDLLSEWQYRTLNVEMSKRGFRMEEPHAIRRESSQVLNKVFNALRKEGTGKADVARALNVYPEDLDELVFNLAMLPLAGGGTPTEASPKRTLRLVNGSGA